MLHHTYCYGADRTFRMLQQLKRSAGALTLNGCIDRKRIGVAFAVALHTALPVCVVVALRAVIRPLSGIRGDA
jgi:hypothetical protein